MYKCVNGIAPSYLSDYITYSSNVHEYNTRNVRSNALYLPMPRTEYFKKSFKYCGPKTWNDIPEGIRNTPSVEVFKKVLKEFLK